MQMLFFSSLKQYYVFDLITPTSELYVTKQTRLYIQIHMLRAGVIDLYGYETKIRHETKDLAVR